MKRTTLIFIISILILNFNCKTQQTSTPPLPESNAEVTTVIQKEKAVQGGMWIPNEVDISDMNRMGLKLNTDDLFNRQQTGLNMAIPHFNGGCTSELISPKGLLLTNHHCGYSQIQSHSTVENDYLTDGFWAYDLSQELANENTTATFVIDIQDVTPMVMKGVSGNLSDESNLALQQQNIEEITKSTQLGKFQNVVIKPYFDGNKYYKIITETFKDVRLVGAPPSSVGKFGSDTDNWMWPRHAGDFSIFRIYADKNNQPAEYSPDNVPYQPKKYLKVSLGGIDQGDYTMVYGFPGRTQEYLPAKAVQNITQVRNPVAIAVRKIALDIIDQKMRKDDATRIKYASKYASVSNYYKKWIGENLGIEKTGGIKKKLDYENKYNTKLQENSSLNSTYQNVLPELNNLHQQSVQYIGPDTAYNEIFLRNSDSFILGYVGYRLVDSYDTDNYTKTKAWAQNIFKSRYKGYDADLDRQVSVALANYYLQTMPSGYLNSELQLNLAELNNNWNKSAIAGQQDINGINLTENVDAAFEYDNALIHALKNDPIVNLVAEASMNYQTKTVTPYKPLQNSIDGLQKQYMAAQMAAFQDYIFYPDANSTLRLTYGKVDPYTNSEGFAYPYQTFLSGVMEKYKPGDYEFDVSQKLRDLYNSKDYGPYGENGKMPVDFIASNHTTGGNSGSPALDANGNLIGLNFDRVWEGTMSDLYYDPSICRNIMVDARYIMFIIDKYANAQNLVNEIETVK